MKKLIEKIKLFWTGKVVPAWQKFLAVWNKIVDVLLSQEFVFVFPLVIFGLAALIQKSFIFTLVTLVWLIPTLYANNGKKVE